MSKSKSNRNTIKKIDVMGENCPIPLVECRKAIIKSDKGQVIEITGNHPASKKEIPMAIKEMGLKLIKVEQEGDTWIITFENTKDEGGT